MSVDSTLAYKAARENGLSQRTIETTWDNAIVKQYGVNVEEAVRIRNRILAGN
jgi:hypothetical protein